jgi:hypothetical protein
MQLHVQTTLKAQLKARSTAAPSQQVSSRPVQGLVALATLAASLRHAQGPTRGPQTTSANQVGAV